ncbi:MAG: flagellar type III secretion system pore protein FliP [Verrucomicrobiae bacterium]|nr:flagellar type III secretion system pore protein FliP [Verrucomicrobiae bacterium]
MKIFGLKLLPLLCLGLILVSSIRLVAQNAPGSTRAPGVDISVRLGQDGEEADVSVAIQLVVLMTLLSLAPAIVLLMTSFMRIIIVLGFLRNALGLQSIPPTQVLVGMAVFLSFFLMMPVGERIKTEAFEPFQNGEVTSMEALELASKPLSEFMLKQTRAEDLELFLGIAGMPATSVDDLPMRIVVPAFVLSELRTAFQMGFLIFLPFLVVDFIVATVLMAMGMMMMPPVIVSLPFKILLFVMVDGWYLVVRSLVASF